jgi:superfamily II DNA helicase RecQ
MDEMWKCGEAESPIQCRLFRISTNPTDEAGDLAKVNVFLGKEHVMSVTTQYVTSKNDYWHLLVMYRGRAPQDEGSEADDPMECSGETKTEIIDNALVSTLKEWRKEEAFKRGWPAYRVLTNSAINELSIHKPANQSQLRSIRGIGKFIEENFWVDIINIIAKHSQENKR